MKGGGWSVRREKGVQHVNDLKSLTRKKESRENGFSERK